MSKLQSSQIDTLRDWTVYEDLPVIFRVSITVIENSIYIVIAKLFERWDLKKPNPSGSEERFASYYRSGKEIFLKSEAFEAILEKAATLSRN